MTTPDKHILALARRMFVERNGVGRVRERAALSGAYDLGSDIQQYVLEATAMLLKQREKEQEG